VSIERDAAFPGPSNYLSRVRGERTPMILNRALVEKGAHLQSLLKSPVDEPPAKLTSLAPPQRMMSVP